MVSVVQRFPWGSELVCLAAGLFALWLTVSFWRGKNPFYAKAPLPPLRLQAASLPLAIAILSACLVLPASRVAHHHISVLGVVAVTVGLLAVAVCLVCVVMIVGIWFGVIPSFLIPPPRRFHE